MDVTEQLKTLLKEAKLYKTQGLLSDAEKKYLLAAKLVRADAAFKNKSDLLEGITRKIESLKTVVHRVEKETGIPDVSAKDKRLIKQLFSHSETDDPDEAAMEGAMALAKFGLFDRAILEFEDLLQKPALRMDAAIHILRCHMAIRSAHDPLKQVEQWADQGRLADPELQKIRMFLENTYAVTPAAPATGQGPAPVSAPPQATGNPPPAKSAAPPPPDEYDPYEDTYVDVLDSLPQTSANSADFNPENTYTNVIDSLPGLQPPEPKEDEEIIVEDYIDYLSSVSIPIARGPRQGQMVEVAVNLQTSDTVNVIVPNADRDLIAMLGKGKQIKKISLNSPISVNTGSALVLAAAVIDQGPKKGDYSVDLKIIG